jgi:hypothetical protein
MTPHADPARAPAPHAHEVRSEEDRINSGKLVFVGLASLFIFFIASWLAASYYLTRRAEHGPLPVPPEIGQNKIGIVEQSVFDLQVRGQRDNAARVERLSSFGWVDRDAGVVHMPIDRAMELVAQGVRPTPDSLPRDATPEAQP